MFVDGDLVCELVFWFGVLIACVGWFIDYLCVLSCFNSIVKLALIYVWLLLTIWFTLIVFVAVYVVLILVGVGLLFGFCGGICLGLILWIMLVFMCLLKVMLLLACCIVDLLGFDMSYFVVIDCFWYFVGYVG